MSDFTRECDAWIVGEVFEIESNFHRQTYGFSNTEDSVTLVTANLSLTMRLLFSRSVRNDASLVPPIRQTASIFKQPVTIYKTQEGKVKDIKHGTQEKPKQVSLRWLSIAVDCMYANWPVQEFDVSIIRILLLHRIPSSHIYDI